MATLRRTALEPITRVAGTAAEMGAATARELPRAGGRRMLVAVTWLVDLSAMTVAVIRQSLRPVTWRRPVRAEFLRFMEIVALGTLPAVCVASALVGASLLFQTLYWGERLGGADDLVQIVLSLLVREIAPLVVALLVLGRGGLRLMGDLGRFRRDGLLRALDAQGVDPFLLLVVPAVSAMAVATFVLTVVFISVAFLAGFTTGVFAGVTKVGLLDALPALLRAVGETGILFLPVKTLLLGLCVGVITALTALDPPGGPGDDADQTPAGFIRAVLGILVVSGLVTLTTA